MIAFRVPELAGAVRRQIESLEFKTLQPLQFATRKSRLTRLGVDDAARLPVAEIDFAADSPDCDAECAALLNSERRYFSKFSTVGDDRAWHGTPCLIDLDLYPDLARYEDRVRRHSKGGILRQIRRARADGFHCRTILRDLYYRQCFEIEASARFRSGPVLAAFLGKPPTTDFANGITAARIAAYLNQPLAHFLKNVTLPDRPPPPCPLHWNIDWGVLITKDVPGVNGDIVFPERLVGFLSLRRAGNVVRTTAIMGHADYLKRHVMKLLFHEIMGWLLARADARVQGIRYLLYGAVEHGNEGLLAWKQGFEFAPYRFRLAG